VHLGKESMIIYRSPWSPTPAAVIEASGTSLGGFLCDPIPHTGLNFEFTSRSRDEIHKPQVYMNKILGRQLIYWPHRLTGSQPPAGLGRLQPPHGLLKATPAPPTHPRANPRPSRRPRPHLRLSNGAARAASMPLSFQTL